LSSGSEAELPAAEAAAAESGTDKVPEPTEEAVEDTAPLAVSRLQRKRKRSQGEVIADTEAEKPRPKRSKAEEEDKPQVSIFVQLHCGKLTSFQPSKFHPVTRCKPLSDNSEQNRPKLTCLIVTPILFSL
jgi:hypothetical protein